MKLRWIVELSQTERDELEELISSGTLGARVMKRALILLRSDDGWTAEQVSDALSVGTATVYRRRERYVEVGLPEALHDQHRPGAERKLDALQEAKLVALACSDAPKGRAKWTMQLLADELVALTDVDDLSRETVRRRLSSKLSFDQVTRAICIFIGNRCSHLAASHDAPKSLGPHQPLHRASGHGDLLAKQLAPYFARPVNTSIFFVNTMNFFDQKFISLCSG